MFTLYSVSIAHSAQLVLFTLLSEYCSFCYLTSYSVSITHSISLLLTLLFDGDHWLLRREGESNCLRPEHTSIENEAILIENENTLIENEDILIENENTSIE